MCVCDGKMMMSGKRFVEVSIYSNFGCFLVILMHSVFFDHDDWLYERVTFYLEKKSGCIITWLQVGIVGYFPQKGKQTE